MNASAASVRFLDPTSLTPVAENMLTLESLGITNPPEEASSELYARILALKGERLVFTPTFRGRAVPGSDGLILNAQNEIVANYSVKTMGEGANIVSRASTWLRNVPKFFFPDDESWMGLFNLNWRGGPYTLRHQRETEKFNATLNWLEEAIPLFGAHDPARRVRLVLHVPDSNLGPGPLVPSQRQAIRQYLQVSFGGAVESVTVILRSDLYYVFSRDQEVRRRMNDRFWNGQ